MLRRFHSKLSVTFEKILFVLYILFRKKKFGMFDQCQDTVEIDSIYYMYAEGLNDSDMVKRLCLT